jgi:hypothetical protein
MGFFSRVWAVIRNSPLARRTIVLDVVPVHCGPHLVVHMTDGFGGTQYANLGERL